MKLLVSAGIFSIATALGQTNHFPELVWKEKESDHIMIRTHKTSTDPARRYSEKTYELLEGILPGLKPDFEQDEFRTPNGSKSGANGRFRFTTYLVDEGGDFQQLAAAEAKRSGWQDGRLSLVHRVGNFVDPQNRFLAICKSDARETGGGGKRDRTPILVHSTGSLLMKGRSRQASLPFWMTAGMGYYAEHMILRKCSVAYLDFEKYYNEDGPGDVRQGAVLKLGSDWARILRDLCKKGERVSLDKVMAADILTLSPNDSGYIFALTYFLVSNEEQAKKYATFIKAIREGAKPDAGLLLKTYGFDDQAALEKAWYAWMQSREFK